MINYFLSKVSPEPNIYFPNSIIDGKKIRAVGNEIYLSEFHYPFYEFLENYAIELIGDGWFTQQASIDNPKHQNPMFRYADDYHRHKFDVHVKSKTSGEPPLVHPSGPIMYWLSLCYDIYCLKHKFSLPEQLKLIEKLKIAHEFQGTRYELAVAAILVRAGCNIQWIDHRHSQKNQKTCELIAIHRATKTSFSVEVKSRRRGGILNEEGSFDKGTTDRNIFPLLKKALKKDPQNLPFLIFFDLNLPPNSNQGNEFEAQKQIVDAVENLKRSMKENEPASFSLIIFTNVPFHYGDPNNEPPLTEYCFISPVNPRYFIPEEFKKDLIDSLSRYGHIPREI